MKRSMRQFCQDPDLNIGLTVEELRSKYRDDLKEFCGPAHVIRFAMQKGG